MGQHVVPPHCDAALLYRAQRLAFAAWREGILVQRERSSKLQRAAGFSARSTLAAAWNGWRAAVAHKRPAQGKAAGAGAGQCQAETQLGPSASNRPQAKDRDSHPSAERIEAAAVSARPIAEAAANTKDSPPAGAEAVGIGSHPAAEQPGAVAGSAAGMAALTGAKAAPELEDTATPGALTMGTGPDTLGSSSAANIYVTEAPSAASGSGANKSTHCSALAARQLSHSGPAAVAEPPSAATGSDAFGAAQGHACADFQVAGSSRGTPVKAASAATVSGTWGSAQNGASADAVATSTPLGIRSAADCFPDSTQPGRPTSTNCSDGTSGYLGPAAGMAGASLARERSAAEQHDTNPQPVARAAPHSMLEPAGSAEAADSSDAAATELQHGGSGARCGPSMARPFVQR